VTEVDWPIGSLLGPQPLGAAERSLLARFADVSGDRNPLHLDQEAARAGGFPDVIAHGMLGMAWAARFVEGHLGVGVVRRFVARFSAPVPVGETIDCVAEVTDRTIGGAGTLLTLAVTSTLSDGLAVLQGEIDCLLEGTPSDPAA
jgi:acyl dehydratase